MIELNQYHSSEYNQNYYICFLQANSEIAAHDWVKLPQYNPKYTVRSLSLIVHRPYICWDTWEVKQMGEFFLNDETYKNNHTFFLHNSRIWSSKLGSFLPQRANYLAFLARNSLSESTDIVKSSRFNYFNCHLLLITKTLDLSLLIQSLFILYKLDMLQTCKNVTHARNSDVNIDRALLISLFLLASNLVLPWIGIYRLVNYQRLHIAGIDALLYYLCLLILCDFFHRVGTWALGGGNRHWL